MLGVTYKNKKELKAQIGKPLQFEEVSIFGPEYLSNGEFTVVGPDCHKDRRYYASVTMENDLIKRVY